MHKIFGRLSLNRSARAPLLFLALFSRVNATGQGFCTANICQSNNSIMSDLERHKAESFWGMFIADAVAMPVHWYYNPADIKRGYGGWLTGYNAPNKRHPSSILTLSATDGSGRSGWHSKSTPVIGDVMLHDKLKYWTGGDRSVHYHQGMSAGDSTLNSLTALQCAQTMQRSDPDAKKPSRDVRAGVFKDYVKFMTTPGSHDDTYAESWHRLLFREWRSLEPRPTAGKDILSFLEDRYAKVERHGGEDDQISSIGALVMTVPWVLHYADATKEECVANTVEALKLSHPAPSLVPYVKLYAGMLHAVLNGADLKEEVLNALGSKTLGGSRKKKDVEQLSKAAARYPAGSDARLEAYQAATYRLGSACYIDGAITTMLFLAHEFHDDFQGGVLTNANCGGENCHRGAALGALLAANAANLGKDIPEKWKTGLNSSRQRLVELTKSRI